MRIAFISDTHENHEQFTDLPSADMIIHGGDITNRGKIQEIEEFLNWFSSLDYKYKIFIAGNQDFYFERNSEEDIKKIIPANVVYLYDSGITIEGIKFWGSPITPLFYNWAFNRERGFVIRKHWEIIPDDTQVLITHGPPMGILDSNANGNHCGCADLLEHIEQIKPQYHLFGHIHESYGTFQTGPTTFINGSSCNENDKLIHLPIIISI